MFPLCVAAQSPQAYYKQKLDTYFSKDKQTANYIGIDEKGITLYSAPHTTGGKVEVRLNWKEVDSLKNIISNISEKELEKLLTEKKDSLFFYIKKDSLANIHPPSLKGMKIALDPGHIGGSFHMGETESRCMNLVIDSTKQIELVEGNLTFFTAQLLKKKLEAEGAIVMITRPDTGISSLGIGFFEWKRKVKTRNYLDSLLKEGLMTDKETKLLHTRMEDRSLFSNVFGPMDLSERARKINAFHPDITVVIHYNVNEKNLGWTHTTGKDYVMAFVAGCTTSSDLKTLPGRLNLLRLLISPDIENSVTLSSLVVTHLSTDLHVPIAKKSDASYLSEHCLSTPATGVYSRNLALTRLIKGTIVYGEPLYQDNEKECCLLTAPGEVIEGCTVSQRIALVADAYYKGILDYVSGMQK